MKKLATVLAVAIIAVVASAEKAHCPRLLRLSQNDTLTPAKMLILSLLPKRKCKTSATLVQAKRTRMTSAKHLRSISRRQITVQHEYVKKLMPSKKNLTKDLKRFWLKRIRPEKLISH